MATAVKAYKGMGMEGSIARWYDLTTRKDMPEVQQLAARIAALVPVSDSELEVAPGPGFLSIELAKRGLLVRAVDISKTFVEIARHNAAAEGVRARFQLGNAAALPVDDASVDFVVCRAAFKNFTEPVKALAGMWRVLSRLAAPPCVLICDATYLWQRYAATSMASASAGGIAGS